jgi:serine/threonine protein kinase
VASEWLDGVTLEAELADRERLTFDEATRWVMEACEGLAEAHAHGLVHGDLKPQNILLAEPKKRVRARPVSEGAALALDHDPRVLKILDFGTTSPLDAIGDQSASAFFGSPAFLAPEQIRGGEVDARADVWALGVLLYNAISGSLPFEADTVSGVLVAVVHDAPALLNEAPYGLARIVHHCLDKDPAGRPRNVAELAAELAPFTESGARLAAQVRAMLEAPPAAPAQATDKPRSRSKSKAAPEPPALIEASATGSVPPVSMPLASAHPVTTTRPSVRVIARRRARSRATALTLVGAAGAIALASWVTAHPWALPSFMLVAPSARTELAPPLQPPPATPPVMATTPSPDRPPPDEKETRSTARESERPEPPISFAPSSPGAMTPTPLAATPTPLATAEPAPAPAAPAPYVLPAPTTPRAARVVTPYRLPLGLPRTRDAASGK